jgi:hypothetical protein
MTAESNTKFMETAISQKIPFLGLIILIFTLITSTRLGVALICHNVLYIIFWDTVYIVYEQCESPATAKGSCRMSRDVWLAERGVG